LIHLQIFTHGRRQVIICGVDTHGECGERANNVGLGSPQRGPGSEPLLRGSAPPKAETFYLLDAQLKQPHFLYFANSLNPGYLWYIS